MIPQVTASCWNTSTIDFHIFSLLFLSWWFSNSVNWKEVSSVQWILRCTAYINPSEKRSQVHIGIGMQCGYAGNNVPNRTQMLRNSRQPREWTKILVNIHQQIYFYLTLYTMKIYLWSLCYSYVITITELLFWP